MTRPAVAALRQEWEHWNVGGAKMGAPYEFVEKLFALLDGAALEAPPEPTPQELASRWAGRRAAAWKVFQNARAQGDPEQRAVERIVESVFNGELYVWGIMEQARQNTKEISARALEGEDLTGLDLHSPLRAEAGPLPPSKTLVEVEWVRAILAAGDKVLDGWGGNRHEQNVEAFRVAMAVRGVVPAPPPEPLEWLLSRIEALTEEQAAYLLDVWSEEIPGNWRQQLFLDLTTEAERQSGRAVPAPQEGPT